MLTQIIQKYGIIAKANQSKTLTSHNIFDSLHDNKIEARSYPKDAEDDDKLILREILFPSTPYSYSRVRKEDLI
jgi:hypothetical protein